MNEKYRTIFTLRLAGYLMYNGFILQDVRNDERGSNRKLFIFNNTPELQRAIDSYKKQK